MGIRIKHIAFAIILAILCLPALQRIFHVFPEKGLDGDWAKLPMPAYSDSAFLSGDFQKVFDPWLEENIGFHNSLVRINNQLDYSLFLKPNAEGLVRGRNGQLFEAAYLRAWTGEDFVGEELLDLKLRQFRFLQKHLKANFDTDLLFILEPDKASVYPEDVPEGYKKAAEGKSNYDYMRVRAKELGINLIDFNAWFQQIKDTIDYPIFPLQGTHWSEFAMWYAADSLISYIEAIREIDLPEVVKDSMDYSMELRSTDYDEGVTLNLLFELEHGEMPYPAYHFREDSTHTKPNVLAIADSYYWNIYNAHIPENLFSKPAFWYFYKKAYPESYHRVTSVKNLNIRAEVEKQDVILFGTTARFHHMIDRGFVDDLMGFYGLPQSRNELTRIKTGILNDLEWFAWLIEESEKKDITLAEAIDGHAHHLFMTSRPETYYGAYGPEPIITNILTNERWYSNIVKSAAEKGISVEERMMGEARWILGNKHPEALAKYDRVQQIMVTIRSDEKWYRYVTAKAGRYYMTEEEMLRAEAEYVFSQERKNIE